MKKEFPITELLCIVKSVKTVQIFTYTLKTVQSQILLNPKCSTWTTTIQNGWYVYELIEAFTIKSKLHIVLVTVVLQMGIDYKHVCQIIHLQPYPDVDTYIQEVGQAGLDGNSSVEHLLHAKKHKQLNNTIKEYLPT